MSFPLQSLVLISIVMMGCAVDHPALLSQPESDQGVENEGGIVSDANAGEDGGGERDASDPGLDGGPPPDAGPDARPPSCTAGRCQLCDPPSVPATDVNCHGDCASFSMRYTNDSGQPCERVCRGEVHLCAGAGDCATPTEANCMDNCRVDCGPVPNPCEGARDGTRCGMDERRCFSGMCLRLCPAGDLRADSCSAYCDSRNWVCGGTWVRGDSSPACDPFGLGTFCYGLPGS